jgi:natural product precursor
MSEQQNHLPIGDEELSEQELEDVAGGDTNNGCTITNNGCTSQVDGPNG